MKLNVTFQKENMTFRPDFHTVVTVDLGEANLRPLLDGTMTGGYEDDKLTYLRMGAFAQCENLTAVRLPNCVCFGMSRHFYECKNITELHLPKLKEIQDATYVFYGLSKLKTISLPELTAITTGFSGTFWGCEALECIELPKLGGVTIQTYAFRNCRNLHTLILGGDTLNPLSNTNAFNNAGNAPGVNLRIYVPDALVEAYKTANNWSSFADKITPISAWEG